MKRFLLTASVLTLIQLGCSQRVMQPPAATAADEAKSDPPAAASEQSAATSDPTASNPTVPMDQQVTADPGAMLRRNPGDFVTYRFSGSYRKSPVTLTQRIVSRNEGVLAVDVTIEDEGKRDELRLRVHDVPGEPDEIVSVARIDNGVLKPFGIAAYEALMAKTMMPVDRNEALLGSEETSMRVGAQAFDCVKSAYRVRAGDALATMTTLESSTFAWGDLGGQIRAADGSLLYQAEVVAYGTSAKSAAGAVAAHADEEDLYDDWAE